MPFLNQDTFSEINECMHSGMDGRMGGWMEMDGLGRKDERKGERDLLRLILEGF